MKVAALVIAGLAVVVLAVGAYVLADQGQQEADDREVALCLQAAEARWPIVVTQYERAQSIYRGPLGGDGSPVLKSEVENTDERAAAVDDCVEDD